MRGNRLSLILIALAVVGATVGVTCGLLLSAHPSRSASSSAGAHVAASGASLQTPRWEYAVITNVNLTSVSGKLVCTAWIRYLRASGAELSGVNTSVAVAADFPKDDAAIRRWMAATNGEEGVALSGINLSPEMVRTELTEQVRRDALAKAFAKLGAEGWEMVSPEPRAQDVFTVRPQFNPTISSSSQPFPFYFKRSSS